MPTIESTLGFDEPCECDRASARIVERYVHIKQNRWRDHVDMVRVICTSCGNGWKQEANYYTGRTALQPAQPGDQHRATEARWARFPFRVR